MNVPTITNASTDTVEENICDHQGTNPIRLNAKDIVLESFDMAGSKFLPPLITNEDCFMVIENKNYTLEVGKVYLTNTTLRHTAVNASKNSRVHIVGCMYG